MDFLLREKLRFRNFVGLPLKFGAPREFSNPLALERDQAPPLTTNIRTQFERQNPPFLGSRWAYCRNRIRI